MGRQVCNHAGETLIFLAGIADGDHTMIGVLPRDRVGVVMPWHCPAHMPSGPMPMVLDSLLDLRHKGRTGIDQEHADTGQRLDRHTLVSSQHAGRHGPLLAGHRRYPPRSHQPQPVMARERLSGKTCTDD